MIHVVLADTYVRYNTSFQGDFAITVNKRQAFPELETVPLLLVSLIGTIHKDTTPYWELFN